MAPMQRIARAGILRYGSRCCRSSGGTETGAVKDSRGDINEIWIIPKFLTRAEQEPNSGVSGVLRTAFKFYCKPMVSMETIHSEGMHFGDLNSPDITDPKSGTPKKFRFRKFISFRKHSLISVVNYFFRIRPKVADIASKLGARTDAKEKRWNAPLTPVICNESRRPR